MNLFLLTALAMVAFAANSILNRVGLSGGDIGPAGFALIRLASGAVVLLALLRAQGRNRRPPRPTPNIATVAALTAYIVGFSFAYVSLDAGVGALLLFGGVQLTMFLGAFWSGQTIAARRWLGMAISLGGLCVLVWPTGVVQMPLGAVALMLGAALGWGIYSLIGTRVSDPLAATAWNFAYALPLAAILCLPFVGGEPLAMQGVITASVSGALTSGLGYALWYRLLPQLGATTAALAQLSVPVIALGAGIALLGEPLTPRAVIACALVCGGIAFALRASSASKRD
ncbi:DMT family transporter [Celeribacter sp.]|uniref:DMT family transporter n=1 Tax=Celeribacter sp. TaxID=1890673 RepID=UPI003A92A01C